MTHLFKINLQFSDIFIKELNIKNRIITFQIRDKNNGNLMEPETSMPFLINENEEKIEFGARFIAIGLAEIIAHQLH